MQLNSLANFMHRYYGKSVTIILDEYDTPMQEAWLSGYCHEAAEFLGGLFNSTFKTNMYMERGLITGITRISKECVLGIKTIQTQISTIHSPFIKEKGGYKPYWFNTSENGLVNSLIQQGNSDLKQVMEKLLEGRSITARIDE